MRGLEKPQYINSGNKSVFQELRRDVNKIVQELTPRRRKGIIFKAVFFPALYISVYLLAITFGRNLTVLYTCYFALGLLLVFVFLNIIHDAVHGSIFQSKKLNKIYANLFDLMGANSYIWQIRHVKFHHNYPNVNGWDTDIEQSDLARVFPDGGFSKIHRYQHIYLPVLYPFFLANWLLVRDFKDFFNKKKPVHKLIKIPFVEYVKLFLFKALFLLYLVVLPKIVLGISWMAAISAFSIMLFTASILALLVLLSPHANTESEFPLANENNELPHSWMMHMMLTTNDVKEDNWFTRFFMGCFNYHVVHHLFPHIHHSFYPEITAVLKEYAEKYQLPYRQYPLMVSLRNHYRLLRQNRMPENIFEETM
jgi:linoleoyl-CoA desaturase